MQVVDLGSEMPKNHCFALRVANVVQAVKCHLDQAEINRYIVGIVFRANEPGMTGVD